MRKWRVDYEDSQETFTVEESDDDGIFRRFDAAEKTMTIDDRKVRGMYIEDFATEQIDVIRASGHCVPKIHQRHNEYKTRPTRAPS